MKPLDTFKIGPVAEGLKVPDSFALPDILLLVPQRRLVPRLFVRGVRASQLITVLRRFHH